MLFSFATCSLDFNFFSFKLLAFISNQNFQSHGIYDNKSTVLGINWELLTAEFNFKSDMMLTFKPQTLQETAMCGIFQLGTC